MTTRPRLDQLTDDQLDQLYTRLHQAEREVERLTDMAIRYSDRAIENGKRAEKAEAELAALKTITTGYCPHCGRGDCSPTADQWLEQRQRADRAEAAIARVRALHGRWDCDANSCASCVDSYGTPVPYPCPTLRALDGTT